MHNMTNKNFKMLKFSINNNLNEANTSYFSLSNPA